MENSHLLYNDIEVNPFREREKKMHIYFDGWNPGLCSNKSEVVRTLGQQIQRAVLLKMGSIIHCYIFLKDYCNVRFFYYYYFYDMQHRSVTRDD